MSTTEPPSAPEPPDSEQPGSPDTEQPEPPAERAGAPAPAAPPTTPPETPAVEEEDRPSTWQPVLYLKIGVLLAVIAYSVAFVVENTDQIKIRFVFTTARVHLIWEILLLLAVGLVGGVLLSQLYRHRRRVRLAQKSRKAGDAGRDVGRRGEAVGKPR